MIIKNIDTNEKLKELFYFLSETFYEEAKEHNEHYYPMSERYQEMKEQFDKDKELLLYVENNDKIVAAVTSKNMDKEKGKITLGVMAVSKDYRRRGIAKDLLEDIEKRCKQKGILHIDLGARFRACPLYISLNYKPSLLVQIFDFVTIDDVKKANIFNLHQRAEFQGETYGFVSFEIDKADEKYIKHFESNVSTAHAQFIFEKHL